MTRFYNRANTRVSCYRNATILTRIGMIWHDAPSMHFE
jgi:hypothetical protein